MQQLLFRTNARNYSALVVRVLVAVVMFAHGAQKLLGWFGGYGFEGTMHFFTETVEIPYVVGLAVIIIEFFGSLFILIGFATRFWAIALAGVTIGIVVTSHLPHFFMNWYGNQPKEGFEFFLLIIGMAVSLVISGAGSFSVDSRLQYSQFATKTKTYTAAAA